MAPDAGIDALVDAIESDAADAAAGEVANGDASGEAAAADGAGSDAAATPPPTPGAPVPADMSMAPVTIAFNNLVDPDDIQKHNTNTEDGPDFLASLAVDVSKTPTLTFTPNTAWAPGKTYVVTVDADAADVLGDKLGTTAAAAFVMAK